MLDNHHMVAELLNSPRLAYHVVEILNFGGKARRDRLLSRTS